MTAELLKIIGAEYSKQKNNYVFEFNVFLII